jgi:adenine deaminase
MRLGMTIAVREGSVTRDLLALLPSDQTGKCRPVFLLHRRPHARLI